MATTPTAQQLAITNLYTALFNRAPDANGLAFWTQALLNGASLATITQGFLNTPESNAIYLPAYTSQQFISAFYTTVFGRAPDPSGLAFWVNALDAAGGSGSAAAKALVVSQIDAIVTTPLASKPANLTDAEYAQTVADRATFANKVAVGVYFALDTKGTDLDLAKNALAAVNANPASVDAGKQVAEGTVFPPTAPVVPVPPPRVILGTEGADTFNLTHLTIGAGDSVDGLGGSDTLNYVDSSNTGVSFPAATVKNVETINIRNVNTTGTSNESVLYYTPASLAVGQSLTIGGLTVTATGGNATSSQIANAIASGITNGNAAVSGSLLGYTKTAGATTVSFTSTVLGNVPDLVVSGTSADTGYIGGLIQGRNGVRDTVAAGNFSGATSFNSDLSTAALTFNGLTAGQTLGVIGNNVITNGDVAGNYVSGVTTATLGFTGGTRMFNVSLAGTDLADVTINSSGSANQVTSLALGSATTTLHINAATNFLTATNGVLASGGITGTALRTVTVSGVAESVGLGLVSSKVLTSIDASGLTAGNVSVTIASPTAAFMGSAGNDTVGVAADVVITSAIHAGAGSADTIAFSTGSSLTSATAALMTGFEVLQLGAVSGVQTYDTTLIAGITSIKLVQSSGALALTKLAAGATVTVSGSVGGDGLSLGLNDASGNADEVSLTLDNGKTATSELGVAVSLSKLKAVNVETIKLHSLGVVATGMPGNSVINDVANTTLSKVVIDGTQATIFYTGTLVGGVELTIDAVASTGYLTVSGLDATKALTVMAGASGSSIRGGSGGDAITLAATGTGVDTIGYFSASQSQQDFVNAAGTALAKQDEIVNFRTGTDKISLGFGFTVDQKVLVNRTFTTTSELVTAQASADFFKDAGNVVRGVVAANIDGDTYLIADANRDGAFNIANDLVVKLAGVAALTQGDLVFN